MNVLKKIIPIINIIIAVVATYVILFFKVDDVTLTKGDVYDFNDGWTITWDDGTVKENVTFPYNGTSKKNQLVTIENTIPEECYGLTIHFISADKIIKAYIDGELVYEFGANDETAFGNTPGEVQVLIDIPEDTVYGELVIEMQSPYNNSAATFNEIKIAEKSVAIQNLYKSNIFEIILTVVVLVLSFVFLILYISQKVTKQDTLGLHYLAMFCVNATIYFLIEAGILSLLYGNQTLYSMLTHIILMVMPVYLLLYYERLVPNEHKRAYVVMLGISCANIVLQLFLQVLGVFDFKNMLWVTYIVIIACMSVIIDVFWHLKNAVYRRLYLPELIALGLFGTATLVDMLRYYFLRVSDIGCFQRYAAVVYSVVMVISHIIMLSDNYFKISKRHIEEIEQKNEILLKAKEEAQAANAAKSKFLTSISHEIRTPINTVLGMDEMILREAEQKEIVDYAVDIQNSGKTLLNIINDILDFSKIEEGKLEIVEKEYDFASFIHDASLMASFKAEEKGIDFIMSVDENLPSRLRGDDLRLRQIVDNLITNGIKFTKAGFVQLVVKGEKLENMVKLHIEIIDTGTGIRQEDIEKLFHEFERIDETEHKESGTGLGLNITSELIRLMGGELDVRSKYGKGTNIFFTIEQEIVNAEPIGNLEERVRERNLNKNKDKYKLSFVAPDANVLVVDDNDMNRRVFKSLLKKTQINIDEADSGIHCLEMIQKKHYDLIFLDHMMPGMDGIDTLHAMESLDVHMCKGTPVIVLTANAIVGAREMYLKEGFDDYMSKPVVAEKLESMIQEHLPSHMVEMVEFNSDELYESTKLKINVPKEIKDMGQIDGVDLEYAFYRLQDMDILMTTLHEFYRMVYVEADNLKELFDDIDNKESLELYRIKVHAMKSSAALIGAMQLSGVAKTLEYAARDGKLDVIKALTEPFLEEWREYKERLKPAIEGENDKAKGEPEGAVIDVDVIRGLLSGIDIALQIMDIDKADELMEKLQSYRFTSDIETEIEKLSGLVVNLEIERVTEQVNKISEML